MEVRKAGQLHRIRVLGAGGVLRNRYGAPRLILVRSGLLEIYVSSSRIVLAAGDAAVSDGEHSIEALAHDAMPCELLVLDPDPAVLCDICKRPGTSAKLLSTIHDSKSKSAGVLQRLSAAMDRTATTQLEGDVPAGFWLEAFIRAQSEYDDSISRCRGRLESRRRHNFEKLSFARALLGSVHNGFPCIESASRTAGLSRWHFIREFRQVFGEPPHQHGLRKRMDQAARLVRETDVPIGDAAATCGFSDYASFARTFRKTFGCSASAMRLHSRRNALLDKLADERLADSISLRIDVEQMTKSKSIVVLG